MASAGTRTYTGSETKPQFGLHKWSNAGQIQEKVSRSPVSERRDLNEWSPMTELMTLSRAYGHSW